MSFLQEGMFLDYIFKIFYEKEIVHVYINTVGRGDSTSIFQGPAVFQAPRVSQRPKWTPSLPASSFVPGPGLPGVETQGRERARKEHAYLDSCVLEHGLRLAVAEENFLGDMGGWEGGVGGLSPLPGPREGSLNEGWS